MSILSAFKDNHHEIIFLSLKNLGFSKTAIFCLEQLKFNESLTLDEQLPYIHFLYLGGRHKDLFDWFITCLEKNYEISWFHWALILHQANVKLGQQHFEALEFLLFQSSSNIPFKKIISIWQNKFKKIAHLRQENWKQLCKDWKEEYHSLVEQIEFLKKEQLIEKEKSLVQKLRRNYPINTKIKDLIFDFNERHQANFLDSINIRENISPFPPPPNLESKYEQQYIESLLKLATQESSSSNEVQDAALFLRSINHSDKAIVLIENQSTLNKNLMWLLLELHLEEKNWIRSLYYIDEIDDSYNKQTQYSRDLTYLKAIALKGCNQNDKALDLLRGLVAIDPNFRSCESLLNSWESS